MPSFINTNIASLNSQNNLNRSQSALNTSLQRLSSGLRINSAKDDAAGMAIADRMTSQINGLTQAGRNANDGISLVQTAEGALSSIGDNLQRMRTLAVQAANGTNSASDRASLQAEIIQLQQEINRTAQSTQFNGQNVIDGALTNAQFQVGANANQTINVAIGNAQATAIGNNTVAPTAAAAATTLSQAHRGTTAGTIPTNVFLAQALTIQGNGTTVTVPATTLVSGTSAAAVATAVNSASGATGVTASATTTATLTGFVAGAVSLTIQGAPTAAGAANPVTVNATLASTTDVTGLASAINAQTGATGITAVADLTLGKITLTQSSGYDIGIKNLNIVQVGIQVAGVTSANTAGTAVTMLGSTAAGGTATIGGRVTFNGPTSFTVSTNAATSGIFDATTAAGSTLSAVSAIDITTLTASIPTGANDALAVIDAALANINSSRASLGAVQNRFLSAVSTLQTTAENITSARSRIMDTDFAAETAALTRAQILQQAGTAMLAQANQIPNGVLALLR